MIAQADQDACLHGVNAVPTCCTLFAALINAICYKGPAEVMPPSTVRSDLDQHLDFINPDKIVCGRMDSKFVRLKKYELSKHLHLARKLHQVIKQTETNKPQAD
jgi:hypothetical protein